MHAIRTTLAIPFMVITLLTQVRAGNYHQSCIGVHLQNTELRADCEDRDQNHAPTKLQLNKCITNLNGDLRWQRNNNDRDGFGHTCDKCRLINSNPTLGCECGRADGSLHYTEIFLNDGIKNDQARLQCDWE